MTWILVRHHPLLKATYIKWLLLMWVSVSLWLGILALRMAQGEMSAQWISVTWIWLAPALYLVLGPHSKRCRELPLSLPIPARTIWNAHVIAVLLTSGLMFVLAIGSVDLVFRGLLTSVEASKTGALAVLAEYMPHFWLHGLAWWLLVSAIILGEQPGVVDVHRGRFWTTRQILLSLLAYAGLSLLGGHSPWLAAVPLAGSLGVFLVNQHRLPSTWSLRPKQPLPLSAHASRPTSSYRGSGWQTPLWATVLAATSKHPLMLLLAAIFLIIMGVGLSGLATIGEGGEDLGIFLIPITAYSIFAMAGSPLMKMAIFDPYPISRHRLLMILLVPQVIFMGIGFVGGEFLANRIEITDEPISWSTEPDRFGLLMSPRYFQFTWGEVPTITGPDGTTATPPADWKPWGAHGPTLYKPFHTPEGASLEFCAWQLERASRHIFGQAISAEEFMTRYITEDLEQRVVLRGEALTLMEDHPGLKPRRLYGTAPLQLMLVGLLFQIAYAIYLGVLRPAFGDRVRKATFVILLGVLMALYMAPFVLSILGLGDPEGLNVLILALGDHLASTMPGGLIGMYLMTFVVLAVGHRLVLQRFRRAEWPPVREDDALLDVLG